MTFEDILKYKNACARFAERLNKFEPNLGEAFMEGVATEIEKDGEYIQASLDNGVIELLLAFHWLSSPHGQKFWMRVNDIPGVLDLTEPIEGSKHAQQS